VPPESDEPITSEAEDQLDRVEFASRLAERILSMDAPSGAVVAICGPWGSGKTSTLNLVKARLRKTDVRQVLDFNPWLFATADQLLQRFFAELSAQFRRDRSVGERVAEHLEAYAAVVVPQLSPLPFAGSYISSSGTVARLLARLLRRRQPATGSLADTKDALEKDLQRLQSPVIVVLDDLDRLQPNELVEVLRLVRLTAKLPHVVYLMAFDWQQVQTSLDAAGIDGRPYLEKIIDLRLDLPAPSQRLLLQLLASHLTSLTASNDSLVFDSLRWQDTLMSCQPLLTTVRVIKRSASAIAFALSVFGDEIELGDLFGLEIWRTLRPDLHARLMASSRDLTETSSSGIVFDLQSKRLKALVESAEEEGQLLKDFCKLLFPAIQRVFGGSNYGPDWLAVWQQERRVAHPAILALYRHGILDRGHAPASLVTAVVQALGDSDRLREFVGPLDSETLEDVLSRLEAFVPDVDVSVVASACSVLLSLYSKLRRDAPIFGFPPDIKIDRVVKRLIERLPGDPMPLVSELVNLSSLTGLRHLINIVRGEPVSPHEGLPISRATEDELLGKLAERVRQSDAATLSQERDLLALLLLAIDKEPTDRTFLDGLLESSELSAAVLRAALMEVRSQALGSAGVKRDKVLDWQSLLLIMGGVDGVESRLDHVEERQPDELTNTAVELARSYLAGTRPQMGGLVSPIERTFPEASPRNWMASSLGPDGPDAVIRVATGYQVAEPVLSNIEIGQQFRARMLSALSNCATAEVAKAMFSRGSAISTSSGWDIDPSFPPDQGSLLFRQSFFREDPAHPVARLACGVFLHSAGHVSVRICVDLSLWSSRGLCDGSEDGQPGSLLSLRDVRSILIAGLSDAAILLPDATLRPELGGEAPPRSIAEFHLYAPMQLETPLAQHDLRSTIDLSPLGTFLRQAPQEGGFAVTGRAPVSSEAEQAAIVSEGMRYLVKQWGYLDGEAGLLKVLSD
jgi:hypothetical protein